jgi:hypothetical protein
MKVKSVNFLDIFVQAEHVNNSFLSKSWPEKKEKKEEQGVFSLGFSVTP